jgi:dephospho-CoA kinase
MPGHNSQERQDKRLVVGVTGRIGAGKTSVAKYLSTAHGFRYVRYSQVLSDWRAEDPEIKARLQAVGWEVMAGGMQAELNARLIARIPPQADCAVDGLRHPIDYDTLSKTFGCLFKLLYIESPLETRWRRLKNRFPMLHDFSHAESHAVEQQIPSLREKAYAILDNDGSLQRLYSKIDAAITGIRNETRK